MNSAALIYPLAWPLEKESLVKGSWFEARAKLIEYGLHSADKDNYFGSAPLLGAEEEDLATMYAADFPATQRVDYGNVLRYNLTPHPTMPIRNGETAAALTIHGQAMVEYHRDSAKSEAQRAYLAMLKQKLGESMTVDGKRAFINSMSATDKLGGIGRASVPLIMTFIKATTQPTADTINALTARLNQKYEPATNPAHILNELIDTIAKLDAIPGSKLNSSDEMKHLSAIFRDDLIFREVIAKYFQDVQPTSRTVADIAPRLQTAYETQAEIGHASRAAFGYGATATGTANAVNAPPPPPAAPPGGGGGHAQTPRPPPGTARPYCWTHGHCGHASPQCRAPLPGHQSTATVNNKMGGATKGSLTY